MIYVTGDLHGFVGLSRLKDWKEGRAGDYLIVAGDFGYPWDFSEDESAEIAWLESRPYRVLFVDGNHERFDHWASRPTEPWGGGMVQRLSDDSPIMRLMRSEVYEIDGARIFTLGGAASIDQATAHRMSTGGRTRSPPSETSMRPAPTWMPWAGRSTT